MTSHEAHRVETRRSRVGQDLGQTASASGEDRLSPHASRAEAWLIALAVSTGIALIVIGAIYFIEPARSLPQLFPGRQPSSDHHHVKHGIAALLLGLACLVFIWFRSAPKPAAPTNRA